MPKYLYLAVCLIVGSASLSHAQTKGSAGTPSTSNGGVIHACYHEHNGRLRKIVGSEQCKKNEIAISWSVTGVAGPQGSPGPQGVPGSPGQPGQQGLPGVSPVITTEVAGLNCPYGGLKLTDANGAHYVCNGAPGGGSSGTMVSGIIGLDDPEFPGGPSGFRILSGSGFTFSQPGSPPSLAIRFNTPFPRPPTVVAVIEELSASEAVAEGFKPLMVFGLRNDLFFVLLPSSFNPSIDKVHFIAIDSGPPPAAN